MRTITFILTLLILSSPLWATVYYVDCSAGNDANDGLSEEEAFEHLAQAADSVSAGDIVYVKSGCTYNTEDGATNYVMQALTPGTITTGFIMFRGYSSTITDDGIADVNADDNALTGCVELSTNSCNFYIFRNFKFAGGSGRAVECGESVDYIKLVNCEICDATDDGFMADDKITIDNCIIHDNGKDGIDVDSSAAITDCNIYNNGAWGILSFSGIFNYNVIYGNTTGAIRAKVQAVPFVACNNTLDGENTGIGISITSSSVVGIEIVNNIIYDFTTGIISNSYDYSADPNAQYPIIRNNLFYSNTTDADNFTTGIDAVTGSDPLFTNEANHDYSIQDSSHADNSGLRGGDIGAIQRDDDESGGGSDTGLPIGSTDKSGGKQ